MNLDERQLLTPQYFEILSPEDQIEYRRLQVEFSSQSLCHRRNFRISIFLFYNILIYKNITTNFSLLNIFN